MAALRDESLRRFAAAQQQKVPDDPRVRHPGEALGEFRSGVRFEGALEVQAGVDDPVQPCREGQVPHRDAERRIRVEGRRHDGAGDPRGGFL